jgi:glutathione synthase/RimK-type ligase-like ATP-grasp enzyme
MTHRAIGIYREHEFSPGKVEADAAIMDAVLHELSLLGVETSAVDAKTFAAGTSPVDADLLLVMCQGEAALKRVAEMEARGILTLNTALAIRNCYRDLLGIGLMRAGVPTPDGAVIGTASPVNLKGLTALDLDAGVYVKRGDFHALGAEDVQKVVGKAPLLETIQGFARRGVHTVYVQQAVEGRVVKFYGVSGGEYFSVLGEEGEVDASVARELAEAASVAAAALGLQAWGGDAVLSGGRFAIIDFNDWPSYSQVRAPAARAIARRAMRLIRRTR